ncbi:MAG: hypothetical protein LBR60_01985 [Fibrobacter sp.]|nr:hypothetical protein [Fibrobacter sp.]
MTLTAVGVEYFRPGFEAFHAGFVMARASLVAIRILYCTSPDHHATMWLVMTIYVDA